jgi:CubicO group peptidase (beta-lactamase class C family)
LERIWEVADAQVGSGRIRGYTAAVRIARRVAVRAGGRMALEPESPPMTEETLFRIASVTKRMGGALALGLVAEGVLELEDTIARWPWEATPRPAALASLATAS